jgi:ferrous iron transport protein B
MICVWQILVEVRLAGQGNYHDPEGFHFGRNRSCRGIGEHRRDFIDPSIKDEMQKDIIWLNEIKPQQKGIVKRLLGNRHFISRLAALGFTPGTMIEMIRNNSHGPILVKVRGVQVALGKGEARHIQVKLADHVIEEMIEPEIPEVEKEVKHSCAVALAGQPNVGKSTIFNALTGLNQHVGNWSGKTVEQKTGYFSHQNTEFEIVDLPGTYSLTANSEEERIARDFIIKDHPDVVIAVADAAMLERSLYLLAELVWLPAPVVLVLNMMDVAENEGIKVEPHVLEGALGIPVVPMSATHGQGTEHLLDTVQKVIDGKYPYNTKLPKILPGHEEVLSQVEVLIKPYVPSIYPVDWFALKLLEGDEELTDIISKNAPEGVNHDLGEILYEHEDAILDIAGARYEWIARMVRAAVVQPKVTLAGMTARLDRVLTHQFWGVLIMLAIFAGVFWATYAVGGPIQQWLSSLLEKFAEQLRVSITFTPLWVKELIAGGILGGVGMVLTFLPILAIFYLFLGFLEDTGYMARAAYLTDRWMHLMGLHGKSFLPILLGFGCNVPAVLGTRIIETKRGRLLTTLLIPLVPCTARLAVVAVMVPIFFGSKAAVVTMGLVGLNLLLLFVIGVLVSRSVMKEDPLPFIMELPLYHMPNFRTIGIYVWHNLVGFLEKAGTTILVASLVVWVLSYFPTGNTLESYMAMIGQGLEPISQWMGLPWQMVVAILTSFVAKENTIATLGVLYGNFEAILPGLITVPAALAFLVFQMLFIPCVGTVAAIRKETNSYRFTLLSLLVMLGLSLGMSVLVYQIGTLL